ncbi:hypothetical protein SPRG_11395 [Saprolegnia parasitica CBS 223.65]|uniref:Uncharacterized protein n=1 Tax=Saprolegnia parasitica (strain CBS 223.65) TaxID=695850 RepID=A0A067C9H4_SAPPC|nr:hypothetical protein SPRG_11395 [Saprolegnia parasitica CBS 223.65]KDO23472.1 hypothetical protein SPRG_11395 [Saprolegnia parasitica CBS 223.65]|eukprot:XP_012205787.1 hypothetical protein SPRG_11395 [Saprolegnia parasitica CBS 223.65]
MLMRKEKEDLTDRARAAEPAPKSVKQPSDDLLKKLARREKELEQCKQLLRDKDAAADEVQTQVQQLQTTLERTTTTTSALQQQLDEATDSAKKAGIELRQLKLSTDDTKKKYQRSIKELKDEKAALSSENAQLAQRLDDATTANAQTLALKKQLTQARDRLASIVADHDARVAQITSAHAAALQELHAQHAQALAQQRDDLASAHAQELQAKLQATTMVSQIEKERDQVRADALRRLQDELKIEKEENVDLLQTVKSLQDKLRLVAELHRDAERAKAAAEVEKEKALAWSAKAEDAADACEAQANKFKDECVVLEEKLSVVDAALRRRGISMDFLLKKKTANNNDDDEPLKAKAVPSHGVKAKKKVVAEPEGRDESVKPSRRK